MPGESELSSSRNYGAELHQSAILLFAVLGFAVEDVCYAIFIVIGEELFSVERFWREGVAREFECVDWFL